MLLVIDVGNTNTVLGVFARETGGDPHDPPRYEQLAANWRVATSRTRQSMNMESCSATCFRWPGSRRRAFMAS